jgi:hypothetical protein
VPTPQVAGEYQPYIFNAVDGTAANDVWAVGTSRNNSRSNTLAMHWDGAQWVVMPTPNGNLNGDNELNAIAAIAPNDVWAVGYYFDNFATGLDRTLILHWNGTQWTTAPSANVEGVDNRLYAVSQVSAADIWSAGSQGDVAQQQQQTLTLRYNDPCVTPSPTATGTPPTATRTATATLTPSCPTGWNLVSSPNIGSNANRLEGVGVVNRDDVWAVGYFVNEDGFDQTLVMKWNGSQWDPVPSPNVGTGHNRLFEVTTLSANDAWAVGYSTNANGVQRTLTLRWNGSAWNVVSSPNMGTIMDNNQLISVDALSANDAWAVGLAGSGTLTMRWNGTVWAVVTSPSPGGPYGNMLLGVSALSSNDVWAVGRYTPVGYGETLALHWDGTQWTEVTTPNPGEQYEDTLNEVVAIALNDVWAVGTYTFNNIGLTLAVHWDGTQWTQVNSPSPGQTRSALNSVTATSASDVWAVGSYVSGSPSITQTVAMRWNGTSWGIAATVNADPSNNVLIDVAAVSPDEVWAVGYLGAGNSARTLTERYIRQCPTATATVTGTVPSTATRTNTPTITPTRTRTATPTQTPLCPPQWTIVSSPNTASESHFLRDVAMVSANDVWAVGYYVSSTTFRNQTLIMHWDGSGWSIVSSPNGGENVSNYLYGVSSVAPNDVWAVGWYGNATGNDRTLTMHWDGAQWTIIDSPNPLPQGNFLYAVDALSSNDVWAVGTGTGSGVGTVAIHWDGTSWQTVATPNTASFNRFHSVSGIAANDVWAVGNSFNNSTGHTETLTMHWDGSAWTYIPSPNPVTEPSYLTGVAAISNNDVWAVGYYQSSNSQRSLAMHWDGSEWSIVLTPNPDPNPHVEYLYINDIAALASNDVWAAGYYSQGTGAAFFMRWNGTAWVRVLAPTASTYDEIYGIAALASSDIWAVGSQWDTVLQRDTLTEHFTPVCPPTATATRTPTATITATASPTTCSDGGFLDVPPGSTFYPFVTCLVDRGIIGGYSDCTFRPNANVTRGQIAKIVSNAAGYSEPQSGQMFADVPPENPFYVWIQRLASRGHMGGYPCGGPDEPCDNENRPYFRSFLEATRGQLSKIVSNAAGFSDTPGSQIFTDVPPSHTFFLWVQRLASRGIMGGYPCGSEGEPCDDEQRPYFRPFNNVTRGQTSKIVAGAFFPNCQTPGTLP